MSMERSPRACSMMAACAFRNSNMHCASRASRCAMTNNATAMNFSVEQIDALDWDKQAGLLPAIVQDGMTHRVLMLGYMNRDALAATLASGRVTFHSRSRGRLWMKGETSGHTL